MNLVIIGSMFRSIKQSRLEYFSNYKKGKEQKCWKKLLDQYMPHPIAVVSRQKLELSEAQQVKDRQNESEVQKLN